MTLALALVLGCFLVPVPAATAARLPTSFTQTTVATGLGQVTAMAFAPDGRLFVASQGGTVSVVKDGALLPTPFMKVPTAANGETGLTGIAVDPDFATNHYVYAYYATADAPWHNRVSRFVADGDVALTSGGVLVETSLLDLDALTSSSHVGGALHFGGDGKLYVSVGDNLVPANAQSLGTTFGKVLRIDKDGGIPADNPYADTATGSARAIWATGVRNPYTFAVQPGTGRIFVDDVGQDSWEEIDELVKGGNYGWPGTEGATADPAYVAPLYAYPHTGDGVSGCAITGGAFYDPAVATYPADYVGDYFFADYCGGWVKRYDPASGTVTDFAADVPAQPVDLQVGPDGNLYVLSRSTGSVTRYGYVAPPVTVRLAPTADSYVTSQSKSTNFGTSTSLTARGGSAAPAASYLRFTLPAAPAGRVLTSVTLRYRTTSQSSAGSAVAQQVSLADDTWTERGITWKNRPAVRQVLGSTPARTRPDTAYTTTLSAALLAPKAGSVSFVVVGKSDDGTWFWSRNHATASYRPELTLTYTAAASPAK